MLFIQTGNPWLVSIRQKAFPLLIGLFIGSLPYIFLPLVWLFSPLSPNASAPWFLVPVGVLFSLWPFVLICQCVVALSFFIARHRQRLITCGILLMLALIFLAILFGWLPPASSLIHYANPETSP